MQNIYYRKISFFLPMSEKNMFTFSKTSEFLLKTSSITVSLIFTTNLYISLALIFIKISKKIA